MVVAHYGRDLPENENGALLGTDETGTRFQDLLNIARLGLDVRGLAGRIQDLRSHTDQGHPCIARVKTTHLPGYPLPPWVPHAAVVLGVARGRVWIHDPAREHGPEPVATVSFEAAWTADQHQYAFFRLPASGRTEQPA